MWPFLTPWRLSRRGGSLEWVRLNSCWEPQKSERQSRQLSPYAIATTTPSVGHVGLTESVAAVRDGELAVPTDRRTDSIPLVRGPVLEVRDHVFRRIVVRVLIEQRQVLLPDAFDSRQLGKSEIRNFFIRSDLRTRGRYRFDAIVNLPHALPLSIVYDDDLGPDGSKKRWRTRAVEGPVPARLIQGYRPQPVDRTRQLHLFFPIEIDQIQELELAVDQHHPEYPLVLVPERSDLLCVGAQWIGPAAGEGFRNNLLIRSNH